MATTNQTTLGRVRERLRIGLGLASITFAIIIVASLWIVRGTDVIGLKMLIGVLALVLIAVPWTVAVRNGRTERDGLRRIQVAHPGALIERVRLWSLPKGPVLPDMPMHYVIADAVEVAFETINQTALLRIPVADIGLIQLMRAQGDRGRDAALTIVYGPGDAASQQTVQVFTVSYDGMAQFEKRLRKAIGWPATGTP